MIVFNLLACMCVNKGYQKSPFLCVVYSNSLYKNKEASQHHDEKCTTIDEVDESINDISTTENGSVTFKVSPEV